MTRVVMTVLAVAAATGSAATPAPAEAPSKADAMWAQVCVNAAHGVAVPNPGPLECASGEDYAPLSDSGVTKLQRICEGPLGGEYLFRVVTREHAYCFRP